MTVKELAKIVNTTVEHLLKQMQDAGLSVADADHVLTDEEKQTMLAHIKAQRDSGAAVISKPGKITLQRKQVSAMRVGGAQGQGKTISVEVRKKRTYVKRSELPQEQPEATQAPFEETTTESLELSTTTTPEKVEIPEAIGVHKKPSVKTEILQPSSRTPNKSRRVVEYAAKAAPAKKVPVVREVLIPETVTVGELAQKMSIKVGELLKHMMKMGVMATINQTLDQETATLIAEELGHTVKLHQEISPEEALLSGQFEYSPEDAIPRAPVVTIMGHVDHGKTSLLDYIRRTKVASGEAGGITQHIGAYHVETNRGMITFLDTPGHEAFTAMRARGSKCTDIVVIVVAADDGVMPQTIEAVQHTKAAAVPMIVAVNKMDKHTADPDRVKNELSQHGVVPEDWGGDTLFVHVSALTGQGVDNLLDAISLQAELLDLKAVAKGPSRGVVLESRLDKGRGAIATVLVQQGTLKKGDMVIAGLEYGRIRAMLNEVGQQVQYAGPSIPVEILGLSGIPAAGDEMQTVETERKARDIAQYRQTKSREQRLAKQKSVSLENLFAQKKGEEGTHVLNVVLKADVHGSLEALSDALQRLSNNEVKVKIISKGIGGISETDVNLAVASRAIMIGFNVRADATARKIVELEKIDLRYFSVIYDVVDAVKTAITGLLSPIEKEHITGLAEVREVFRSPKLGAIAGCMVIEGKVKRNNPIRVLRENVVIYQGQLESLRRFKEDVNEVRNGMECGIGVKDYNDVKPGDQIEVYEIVQEARKMI